MLCTARPRHLERSGQPVLTHEDFVNRHAEALPWLCEQLGLPWCNGLGEAKRLFPHRQRGHRGMNLSAPVRTGAHGKPAAGLPWSPLIPTAAGPGLDRYAQAQEANAPP